MLHSTLIRRDINNGRSRVPNILTQRVSVSVWHLLPSTTPQALLIKRLARISHWHIFSPRWQTPFYNTPALLIKRPVRISHWHIFNPKWQTVSFVQVSFCELAMAGNISGFDKAKLCDNGGLVNQGYLRMPNLNYPVWFWGLLRGDNGRYLRVTKRAQGPIC